MLEYEDLALQVKTYMYYFCICVFLINHFVFVRSIQVSSPHFFATSVTNLDPFPSGDLDLLLWCNVNSDSLDVPFECLTALHARARIIDDPVSSWPTPMYQLVLSIVLLVRVGFV